MKDQKIIKEIASAVIDYLKKNKKEDLLSEVIDILKKKEIIDEAKVFSPRKLSSGEKEGVNKLIKKLSGEVPNNVTFLMDPKLIDGLKISYKDKLWDFSLKKQISSLAKY